jgi:hypothetical protein
MMVEQYQSAYFVPSKNDKNYEEFATFSSPVVCFFRTSSTTSHDQRKSG